MKNPFLLAVFTLICCTANAQTKRPDSIKRNVDTRLAQSQPLVQQKIWPVPNAAPIKTNEPVIINPRPTLKTWVRL